MIEVSLDPNIGKIDEVFGSNNPMAKPTSAPASPACLKSRSIGGTATCRILFSRKKKSRCCWNALCCHVFFKYWCWFAVHLDKMTKKAVVALFLQFLVMGSLQIHEKSQKSPHYILQLLFSVCHFFTHVTMIYISEPDILFRI